MKLHKELGGDWEKIIVTYNGGYRQLTKLIQGDTLASETAEYVNKAHSAFIMCGLGGIK